MSNVEPNPTFVDGPKEMIQNDVKAEEEAINPCKQIVKAAEKEDDVTTRKVFEDVLSKKKLTTTLSQTSGGMVARFKIERR